MSSGLIFGRQLYSPFYRRIFSAYWGVPYEFRRTIFRIMLPGTYHRWQNLRYRTEAHQDDFSLAPFDEKRSIFVHIPKCAGTSLAISLFGNRAGGHKSILQYQLIFSSLEFESYFKFTFVRNPWDRLVSAFLFLQQGGATENDRSWVEKNITSFSNFGSFVRNWVNPRNVFSYYHFIPQYVFLSDIGKPQLPLDFVGRFENLNQDFEKIRARLNVNTKLSLHNKTINRQNGYRDYYDSQTKDIVANVYGEDIRLFGYTF